MLIGVGILLLGVLFLCFFAGVTSCDDPGIHPVPDEERRGRRRS